MKINFKLYKADRKSRALILSFILISSVGVLLAPIGSSGPGHRVYLPNFSVNMVVAHPGTQSYFDATLSGIGGPATGFDVYDGTYVSWCCDESHYITPGTTYTVTLYSSYDPLNPWPDNDWDMVNYVINNKDPTANKDQIQNAIWYFIDGGYTGSDPVILGMINDAIANGEGFVPVVGELCAVICDAGATVQHTFIEVLVSACPPIVYVDDDYTPSTLGWGYDHFDNIQDGTDVVCECGTIYVAAGTYTEQILIYKSLELLGDPGATIVAPDVRNTYTIAESSYTFDPIIFAYGGTLTGDHVSGTEMISVEIDGFEIDGGNKASASPRFVAILYRNIQPGCTLSQISNNVIHSMYDADGEGNGPQTMGIVIYGDSEVTILTNEVSEFSRLGIGAIGNNGPNDPVVVIEDNTVTGNGLEIGTDWWAENGIQIGIGAGGDIIDNIVSDCQVNNPSWFSSGIIVDDAANGVEILDNDVTLCDTGISIRSPSYDIIDGNTVSFCNWDALRLGWPTDNATVTDNIFTDSLWGIYNADASDNLIEYNLIENNVYGIGIDGDSHNNLIRCNDILDNTDHGVYLQIYYATPTGNEIHCNNIVGNGLSGVENIDLPHDVDATCNWWGAHDGPSGFGPGSGDAVSDNVDYDPWVSVEADAGGPYADTNGVVYFFGTAAIPGCCGVSVSYDWDFGDGTGHGNTLDTVHRYDNPGTYTATLTVTSTTICGNTYSDTDTAAVHITGGGDEPKIYLLKPEGGEELSGTVTIEWYAWIPPYVNPADFTVNLYYSNDNQNSMRLIVSGLHNNDPNDLARGSYSWDTTRLADGEYFLLVEAINLAGDRIGHDMDPPAVVIDNGAVGTKVSDVYIFDTTINSDEVVKDGHNVEVSAGITGGTGISSSDIVADLSSFGGGSNVPADEFDGLSAIWNIEDVKCTPSNGEITVTVSAGGDSNSDTINAENKKSKSLFLDIFENLLDDYLNAFPILKLLLKLLGL